MALNHSISLQIIFKKIKNKLMRTARNLFPQRVNNFDLYISCFKGKKGLEIGGPSNIFKESGLLPIYKIINDLDGCNFCTQTVWEGQIEEGPKKFLYHKNARQGYQYVKDAVDLCGIDNEKYDFVLSSHAIEHIANPLKAINEWLRILKTDGLLLLIVPDKERTFDHLRSVTSLQHLIEDYKKSITEDDLSHLQEILALHDLELDPAAGDFSSFQQRSIKNHENRCLHHHVFDYKLITQVVRYFNLQLLDIQFALPYHIIALVQKA
jgi:SAM-dependent methyltransferase